MGFDFNYMMELMPILLKYLGTTMSMATWGLLFSLILSVILANIRVFKVPVLDQPLHPRQMAGSVQPCIGMQMMVAIAART